MDIVDQAQEEHERAMARFERARSVAPVRDSALECQSCGFDISQDRREQVPGVQTCVECQTLIERGVMRL